MNLKGKKIGVGITGSHCTLQEIIPVLEDMVRQGAVIYPVVSPAVMENDTRFGAAKKWLELIAGIAGREPFKSIVEVEPIGPYGSMDAVVILPCTGNTLAKLSGGITDTAVLMAAKAQLRNQGPVILAISTNDGLGINLKSLANVLNTKNVYLVPFYQDDPESKPNSISSRLELVIPAVKSALQGKQIQPLLSIGENK